MGIQRRRQRREQQQPIAGTDMEEAFLEKADEPLRKLEHQTLSFTYMWRQALQRLSLLLVLYAAFATYRTIDEHVFVTVAHIISGFLYASLHLYVTADIAGKNRTAHPWFILSVMLSLSLIAIFTYAYMDDGDLNAVKRKMVPVASGYHLLVHGSLLYMASMAHKLSEARTILTKIDRSK